MPALSLIATTDRPLESLRRLTALIPMPQSALDQYRSIFQNEPDPDVIAVYSLALLAAIERQAATGEPITCPDYPPADDVRDAMGSPSASS